MVLLSPNILFPIFSKGEIAMLQTLLIALSLAMDAFAVSVSTGIAVPGFGPRQAARIGTWCGVFQFVMPLAGWFLGSSVKTYIEFIDHWIAFGLLAFIGGSMIREALSREEEDCDPSLAPAAMLLLAVATSIDALAVGVTFAFLQVELIPAVTLIGVCTFLLSAAGVKIGHLFGVKYKSRAELLGGAVLVLIGLKILLEHLDLI